MRAPLLFDSPLARFPRSDVDQTALRQTEARWLGMVPHRWRLVRLKRIAGFCGGGTPSKENIGYWEGNIPWVSPKDMKSEIICDAEDHISQEALAGSSTRLVQPGAVLVVVRSGILKNSIPVAINSVEVALNQDMKAITTRQGLLPEYLAALIRGHQSELLVEWRKQGATVDSLEFDLLANTLIPVPTLSEQQRIVSFLDRETAKIDALIAKKQRLIELLQEKCSALISHAVTKGLDPGVPMKKSGIDSLDQIPQDWELLSVKRFATAVEQGWSPVAEDRQAEDEEWAVRSLAKIDCPIRGQECYNGLDAEPYSTGHQSEIHQP